MSDLDPEVFEAELRKLRPARPPAELMARLMEANPAVWEQRAAVSGHDRPAAVPQPSTRNSQPLWSLLLRWLVPAGAMAAVMAALLVWWPHSRQPAEQARMVLAPEKAAFNSDEVEIDRQLVALFDAVAQLPSGQPVRFRCRQWNDEVVLRDAKEGLVIERRTPRLEVVPVSLEIY
jgi:hypothetical protein